MNSAARTTLSLAAGIAVLALNFTVAAPAEAQSVRAELLAGAERGQAVQSGGREHRGHGQNRRSNHGHGGRHGRHNDRHHNRHKNRHDNRHHDRGGHHGQDHYYESGYYKARQRKARSYASEAVAQAREARRLGLYTDHPRWSLNFDRHYRWALDRPPRKLEREHYDRAAKLRELRAYHYGHNHGHRGHRRHGPYGRH